mgnify:CR=1 FL=1
MKKNMDMKKQKNKYIFKFKEIKNSNINFFSIKLLKCRKKTSKIIKIHKILIFIKIKNLRPNKYNSLMNLKVKNSFLNGKKTKPTSEFMIENLSDGSN